MCVGAGNECRCVCELVPVPPPPQNFLDGKDLKSVREAVDAALADTPNRLGANAEPVVPVVDLRALPPPHLTSSVLLTGAMAVAVGADAAGAATAARRAAEHSFETAEGGTAAAVSMFDSGLHNFIAAHATRELVEPPPAARGEQTGGRETLRQRVCSMHSYTHSRLQDQPRGPPLPPHTPGPTTCPQSCPTSSRAT